MYDCFFFGSCRIIQGLVKGLKKYNVNFNGTWSCIKTHNTIEIINILKFCKFDVEENYLKNQIPYYYHNVHRALHNFNSGDKNRINYLISNSKLIVLEISSLKNYHFNFEKDREYKFNEIKKDNYRGEHILYSKEDLEKEILEIHDLLKKPILLIPHINFKLEDGSYIKNRELLEKYLLEVSEKYNYLYFVNPVDAFKDKDINDIFNKNMLTYSENGFSIWYKYLNNKIKEINESNNTML